LLRAKRSESSVAATDNATLQHNRSKNWTYDVCSEQKVLAVSGFLRYGALAGECMEEKILVQWQMYRED
jgi:hypothetical protein